MSAENFRRIRGLVPASENKPVMSDDRRAMIREVMQALGFELTHGNFWMLDKLLDWNATAVSMRDTRKLFKCRIRNAGVNNLPVVVDEERFNPDFYEKLGEL